MSIKHYNLIQIHILNQGVKEKKFIKIMTEELLLLLLYHYELPIFNIHKFWQS